MKPVQLIFFAVFSVCLLSVSEITYARHAAILVDANNGSILNEVESTHAWYPASLTKLMTIYMAFDALSTGQIQLQDPISTSYHASRQPNSKLGLRVGETLTVEDAILALITRSANDAAVALAEYIGGTEESFAVKMTEKAHSIGMYDTHFMNATGLPHPWQVSTARDLGLLAWRTLNNFPEYYPYFSAHSFNFRGAELHAINKFTEHYPGAEGMKTGFTCGSGYNLISTASQNGKRLIGVILGGTTSPQRYQLMIDMMDAGFSNQYVANPGGHIESAVTRNDSQPPHQLGCGNGGATVVASTEDENSDRIAHRTKVVASKHPKVGHVLALAGHKSVTKGKVRTITAKAKINNRKPAANAKTVKIAMLTNKQSGKKQHHNR